VNISKTVAQTAKVTISD